MIQPNNALFSTEQPQAVSPSMIACFTHLSTSCHAVELVFPEWALIKVRRAFLPFPMLAASIGKADHLKPSTLFDRLSDQKAVHFCCKQSRRTDYRRNFSALLWGCAEILHLNCDQV
jgi:hypothetical protein